MSAAAWTYVALFVAGFLPNELWRVLGLLTARGLNEESELVILARVIATAIIAGVVAKLILFPPGALAAIPLEIRLGATAIGCISFLASRQSVFAGVAAGELALVIGGFFFGR